MYLTKLAAEVPIQLGGTVVTYISRAYLHHGRFCGMQSYDYHNSRISINIKKISPGRSDGDREDGKIPFLSLGPYVEQALRLLLENFSGFESVVEGRIWTAGHQNRVQMQNHSIIRCVTLQGTLQGMAATLQRILLSLESRYQQTCFFLPPV